MAKEKEINFYLYIPTLTTALLYGTLRPARGLKNVEKVQERSLKFTLNDYYKSYFQL